jgi:hypothetical protein
MPEIYARLNFTTRGLLRDEVIFAIKELQKGEEEMSSSQKRHYPSTIDRNLN